MSAKARKLKILIAQRAVEKTKLSELAKVADEVVLNKIVHNTFKCRFRNTEYIRDSIDTIHNNVMSIVSGQDDVDISSYIDKMNKFDTSFYNIQGIYLTLFGKEDSNATDTSVSHQRQQNVKLPKIEISHFEENFKHLQTFIHMFDSLIHSNNTLSNIEKFNYMISFLREAPLTLVPLKCV